MFSGIVEAVGTVAVSEPRDGGLRLAVTVPPAFHGLPLGSSVAVNGTCLTVVESRGDRLAFDAVGATLDRTRLATIPVGAPLNLERSLTVGDPVDGHWVTGHVDGIGELAERRPADGAVFFSFVVPAGLRGQIATRGSVAVDGVSLTVSALTATGFTVSIVPYTLNHTIFGTYGPGDHVHIETDVLAKYVERSLTAAEIQS